MLLQKRAKSLLEIDGLVEGLFYTTNLNVHFNGFPQYFVLSENSFLLVLNAITKFTLSITIYIQSCIIVYSAIRI